MQPYKIQPEGILNGVTPRSPNLQGMNPNLQGMNPNLQGMNPNQPPPESAGGRPSCGSSKKYGR